MKCTSEIGVLPQRDSDGDGVTGVPPACSSRSLGANDALISLLAQGRRGRCVPARSLRSGGATVTVTL